MNQPEDKDGAVERRKQFEDSAAELLNRLPRIVYSWTHDAALAEDIAQEAVCRFLRYMNARNWPQKIANFDAFVTKIAKNYWIDLRRKQGKRLFLSLDDDPDEKLRNEVDRFQLLNAVFDGVDPEELEKLREDIPFQMIFHELDEEDLELLELHRVEGLKPKAIAKMKGEDADRIRYRLNRIETGIRYRAKQYLKASGKKSLFEKGH